MAGDAAEPWRRTGRKAGAEHLIGLEKNVRLEVALYHDNGSKQGQAVIQILDDGEELDEGKGKIHTVRFHAIEDEYYEWWVKKEFSDRPVPVHF